MDFLESSSVLVPALTGMALTVCDGGADALSQFEEQNCFSPQLQKIYTAKGLESFLRGVPGNVSTTWKNLWEPGWRRLRRETGGFCWGPMWRQGGMSGLPGSFS